jgi:hypothetical protein
LVHLNGRPDPAGPERKGRRPCSTTILDIPIRAVATPSNADARERADDPRDRDPRDAFLKHLELLRGAECELVVESAAAAMR